MQINQRIWTFVEFLFVGALMGFMWNPLSTFLASHGIPTWIQFCGIVLFYICIYDVMMKIWYLQRYPKASASFQTNIKEVTGKTLDEMSLHSSADNNSDTNSKVFMVDAKKFIEFDTLFQSLNFKHLTDFYVGTNDPITNYGRLLISNEHRCRCEMFQMYSEATGKLSICAINSMLRKEGSSPEDLVFLSTITGMDGGTGTINSGQEWAARNSHFLWSHHSNWTANQLLSFHLHRREQIMKSLQLSVVTDLGWEGYCSDGTKLLRWQRERLKYKVGIITLLERIFSTHKTEWWGNYQKFVNKAV
jgi:hypothetical protein